jgi:glycosyltransferase involved in cell wall biosynthesis
LSLRILHVTDRLNERGGAQRYLLSLLNAQRDAGHELHLACAEVTSALAAWATALVDSTEIIATLAAREAQAGGLPLLEALTKRLAPDIVHLHTVVNPAVLAWAGARPAVVTVQDHRYFCPTRGKWTHDGRVCQQALAHDACAACFEDTRYFESIYALTVARRDALRRVHVGVLSHYMRNELLAVGLGPAQVMITPPWVEALRTTQAPPALPDNLPAACVLVAGRLAVSKGVWDALAAWRASEVALPLVCAGTGPLRAALEAQGVQVTGWLDHATLLALYARARALLLASRWQEPFGLVGLEASTHGVPVVAWDSGGVREWHPGGDLLVPWGDHAALAATLRRALGRRVTHTHGFTRAAGLAAVDALYARARRA